MGALARVVVVVVMVAEALDLDVGEEGFALQALGTYFAFVR